MTKENYIEGQLCQRCLEKDSCTAKNVRCHKYHEKERDWEACQNEMIERACMAHCSLCSVSNLCKNCHCHELDTIRRAMEE